MNGTQRYWITVVCKDHIKRGVAAGFMQAGHGKPGALKKLHVDDWVMFYSPKVTYEGDQKLQAFTAIGQVTGKEIYQHKISDTFIPYRRDVYFYPCNEVPFIPLVAQLEFIKNKKAWGYHFRFGFFEIGKTDFDLIRSKMLEPQRKSPQSIHNVMANLSLNTSIEINAPAPKVWEALTNPVIVKQYFFGTNVKTDWKKGSPIIWEGEWEGKSYRDKGEILEIDPGRYVRYSYWSAMSGTADIPENYADITYTLTQKEGLTKLTITQGNLKSEESKNHSRENWQSVFGKMKQMVEQLRV